MYGRSKKIDRDFVKSDFQQSEFRLFIKNISGNRDDSTRSMESTADICYTHTNLPATALQSS